MYSRRQWDAKEEQTPAGLFEHPAGEPVGEPVIHSRLGERFRAGSTRYPDVLDPWTSPKLHPHGASLTVLTRRSWEYAHTSRLAAEEDHYFADHPLFRTDQRELGERFVEQGRLADLGCGTGRHAIWFAQKGFSVTAVDLSRPMLEMVGSKARAQGIDVVRIQANLCQLGCFPDGAFDYAPSMFSTLGMIRGRASRRQHWQRPTAFCGRAAEWRFTLIISG